MYFSGIPGSLGTWDVGGGMGGGGAGILAPKWKQVEATARGLDLISF
jgi:hypothetical protein